MWIGHRKEIGLLTEVITDESISSLSYKRGEKDQFYFVLTLSPDYACFFFKRLNQTVFSLRYVFIWYKHFKWGCCNHEKGRIFQLAGMIFRVKLLEIIF